MLKRKYGNTGLELSILGFGAGNIGLDNDDEKDVEELLNYLIDNGINFIDTARGYNLSEERIGKYLSHRRNEFILSTKVGYGIEGYQDWTYDCIIAGVDHALNLMRTDHLDIVHLHSCPKSTLEQGNVISALEETVRKGKVRFIAYSGENESLEYAISTDRFDGVQCSVNICDQRVINNQLVTAKTKGMGVIAKRPIANSSWRFLSQPYGDYSEEYWLRLQKMSLPDFGMSMNELAIRFLLSVEQISSLIIGTTNMDHIKQNMDFIKKGVLPSDVFAHITNSFKDNDNNWLGQI